MKKTEKFIKENNIKMIRIDSTNKYQAKIRKKIKESDLIINNNISKFFINVNPKAPILNLLLKIHKPEALIRPLINYITAPGYKLAKFITKIIKNTIMLNDKYVIKNRINVFEKLQNITINVKTKIISYDISNLHTNLSISETLEIIEKSIKKTKNNIYNNQLLNIIKTVTEQNYFTFNKDTYTQNNSLGMGYPLSGILSEIFLQHLEKTYMENLIKKYNIKLYIRYVDDTLIIFDENNNYTENNILNDFNKIHKNIQCTMEKAENNKINFLGIIITKTNDKPINIYTSYML